MKKQPPSQRFSVRLTTFLISFTLVSVTVFPLLFAFRLLSPTAAPSAVRTVTVIRINDTFPTAPDGIAVGDTVVDSVTKRTLGCVSAVSCATHKTESVGSDGFRVRTDRSRADMTLTVIGTERHRIGETLYLRLRGFTGSGICIDCKEDI